MLRKCLRKPENISRLVQYADCARKSCIFCKRTLVGAVGCALALSQSGNARMHAPLLLFPQNLTPFRFSGILFVPITPHGRCCGRGVNFARFIKSNCAFQNRILNKRTLVGAVGCPLASPQSGNARMHAPLLLFPKISLRCDFREPFCRKPATKRERVNAAR